MINDNPLSWNPSPRSFSFPILVLIPTFILITLYRLSFFFGFCNWFVFSNLGWSLASSPAFFILFFLNVGDILYLPQKLG